MLIKRITAFIIDYILTGVLIYFTLEPFFPAKQRFETDSFFIDYLSLILFIIYLLLSFFLFKKTIGMKIFNLKITNEKCKCSPFIRTLSMILLPFNLILLFKGIYIQDLISNSNIEIEQKEN